jgi:hypothetical protein
MAVMSAEVKVAVVDLAHCHNIMVAVVGLAHCHNERTRFKL